MKIRNHNTYMYNIDETLTLGVGWHMTPGDVGDDVRGEAIGVRGEATGVSGDEGGSTALTVMPSFRRSNV